MTTIELEVKEVVMAGRYLEMCRQFSAEGLAYELQYEILEQFLNDGLPDYDEFSI